MIFETEGEKIVFFYSFVSRDCLHVSQNKCPVPLLVVAIYILMFKSDSAPKIQVSKGNGHGKDLT